MIWALISILLLAFAQNVSFSIVSRSRNRSNFIYHMIASVLSNGVWFLTFRELVKADMSFVLFIPYTIGTVAGSLTGVKISMLIEKWLGANSDGHLTPKHSEPLANVSKCECGHHIGGQGYGAVFCNLPLGHVGHHNKLIPGRIIQ